MGHKFARKLLIIAVVLSVLASIYDFISMSGPNKEYSTDVAIISFTEISDNGLFEYICRNRRILVGCCLVNVSIEAFRKAKYVDI